MNVADCPLCGALWGENANCFECGIARKVGVGVSAEGPRVRTYGPDPQTQDHGTGGEA